MYISIILNSNNKIWEENKLFLFNLLGAENAFYNFVMFSDYLTCGLWCKVSNGFSRISAKQCRLCILSMC